MSLKKLLLLLLLAAIAGSSGCYTTPVRHLASDVALLNVGKSTQQDVLVFLGEPDEQQVVGGGVERWFYENEDQTVLEKTPYVGKYFGSPEYNRVVVTLTNGIVTDCTFLSTDADDYDWADDFSWQEREE
ncbi:MAG: hypothetical protein ACWGOX_01850 [Desulforhopalus sp.]